MSAYTIHGHVHHGYKAVRRLFERNFSKGLEEKAQLCVYVGEDEVVNLYGTVNEPKSYKFGKDTVDFSDETLIPVFSCSKALTAICIATLVDKGLLKYSDNVVQHWPEYGNDNEDKESITVENILRHEGGMPKFSETLTLADIQPENIKKNSIGRIVEAESLCFPPEEVMTNTEYHTFTSGFILNEIFRRVDPQSRTIGECLRQDISNPLGVDVYIGLTYEELRKSTTMSVLTVTQVLRNSFRPKCMGRKVQCSINRHTEKSVAYKISEITTKQIGTGF